MSKHPRVIQDATYPGMYRVRWPDGHLSDMVNLSRANDAVAAFEETLERRTRGRQSPREGRTCVKPAPRMGA